MDNDVHSPDDQGRQGVGLADKYCASFDLPQFSWVVPALAACDAPNTEQPDVRPYRSLLSGAGQVWQETSCEHATIAALFTYLGTPEACKSRVPHGLRAPELSSVSQAVRDQFARLCIEHGIDFGQGLRRLSWGRRRVDCVALYLLEQKLVDPRSFVDVNQLLAFARDYRLAYSTLPEHAWRGHRNSPALDHDTMGGASANAGIIQSDLASPAFWLGIQPSSLTSLLKDEVAASDDERASELTVGLLHLTRHVRGWLVGSSLDLAGDRLSTVALLQATADILTQRLGERPHTAPACLRRALLELWGWTWWMLPLDYTHSHKRLACELATYDLAVLRSFLKPAKPDAPPRRPASYDLDGMPSALIMLGRTGATWERLRCGLLVLRDLQVPALANDLRYWEVHPDSRRNQAEDRSTTDEESQPPQFWRDVGDHIASSLHDISDAELEKDKDLLDLRTQFARFCLDRLVSEEKGGPPVETCPHWREACVQAVRELRVNPRRKGHHVMWYAAQADPSPRVRELAKLAFDELRENRGLKGRSPRTASFHAVWWLFRAHMLSLNAHINEKAAESTRDRMIRRTTRPDPDRDVSPSCDP